MGDHARGLFKRARDARARDKPSVFDAVSQALTFYFGGSTAGKSVTPRTSLQLSTVYACVRVIAETVASLPLHVYRKNDLGSEKADDSALYRLLHDEPNPEMTSFAWREAMLSHLLLWGNSYSQIIRDGRGAVVALYPLLPERMTVDRDGSGRLIYDYERNGVIYGLRAEEVLHIPGLGFDGIMGHSPIALEKNALGLAIAAEEYGSKFFANGATPSGVLKHPETVKDPSKLRQSWNSVYGGSGNAGKVAILEEGMDYKQISIPNNEAQFLESRKFQVEEICRIYRVPPHMVGHLEHATFSNIENQSISFGVHTIRPWLVRIEQSLNRAIVPERLKGQVWTGFNMDGLLRGDYESRMKGYSIGIQNGFLCPNDVREMENRNRIPPEKGGDDFIVNGNMVRLEDAGKFAGSAPSTTKDENDGKEDE